jgi:hypothetical protein
MVNVEMAKNFNAEVAEIYAKRLKIFSRRFRRFSRRDALSTEIVARLPALILNNMASYLFWGKIVKY